MKPQLDDSIVFVDSEGYEYAGYVARVYDPPGTMIDVTTTPRGGPGPHPADEPPTAQTYRVVHEIDANPRQPHWREADASRPLKARPSAAPAQPNQAHVSVEDAETALAEARKAAKASPSDPALTQKVADAESRLGVAKAQAESAKEAEKEKAAERKEAAKAEKAAEKAAHHKHK